MFKTLRLLVTMVIGAAAYQHLAETTPLKQIDFTVVQDYIQRFVTEGGDLVPEKAIDKDFFNSFGA